jgi:hypothetical protein
MAAMQLGSYTFEWQPERWTIPKKERTVASVKTYESNVFFSFGITIVGKEIVLEWHFMSIAQFNALYALYISDIAQTWIPGNGGTYIVEILDLVGDYFETVDYDLAYRRNVKMRLSIKSCTVEPSSC